MLCTVSSYPIPLIFLHVAAIMIIFCTTLFFLVSRWRQRNWLKKRLRSKDNTSWYVPFLLPLVAASSLLFYCMFLPSCLVYPPWLCLHYDPELAALLSASKNYPFTYTVCWNVSKLDIKKVIVLANMMIQSVWKSLKNVLLYLWKYFPNQRISI